jgi:hypothetical protein
VRIPTTTVTAGSSICVVSSPSTKGPSSQIEATAIAGMVSPMLAGRAERQVETGLDSVPTCSPCRRQRLRQQDQQGDHHANE